MIGDNDVAAEVSDRLLAATRLMDESIALVQQRCSDDEFKAFRAGTGKAMGYLFAYVLRELWLEHPCLAPEGLDMNPPSKKKGNR
ncbi:hypothetical protein [Paraburkholderia phytofirmans]|uniref:Uncharacterized protein n=1 Tax=Paraburkholderia phytofirmans OLGA172 TaxID=1417228 RepID=A0A160FND9_9BURK|nr:hypothetical protein [Paraburkholderia phytofirmans]ANB73836.1 hypothetical protein AYM40_16820 [Paraburkholderia phytofirmans OLGA172]